jgi:DNA-binding MarR family transcriptional regulator
MSMYGIRVGPNGPTTGYLIWRLSTKWRADVDRALAPLGLTHAQFAVLGALSTLARDGQRPNQRRLAAFTGLEPLYVSRLARALEAAGLVERPADPADPRAVRLALTDRGRDVVAEAAGIVHERHAALTAAIGGPDGSRDRELRATLLTLLDDTPLVQHNESEPTMTRPRVFNGEHIGVAAAASRSVLDALLDSAGITFLRWVVLRRLAGMETPVTRDAAADAVPPVAGDRAAVLRTLDELAGAGLVQAGDTGTVTPTARGRQVFEEITAAAVRAGDKLFDGISADDQLVTKKVLDLITERAQAVRAELTGQAL